MEPTAEATGIPMVQGGLKTQAEQVPVRVPGAEAPAWKVLLVDYAMVGMAGQHLAVEPIAAVAAAVVTMAAAAQVLAEQVAVAVTPRAP